MSSTTVQDDHAAAGPSPVLESHSTELRSNNPDSKKNASNHAQRTPPAQSRLSLAFLWESLLVHRTYWAIFVSLVAIGLLARPPAPSVDQKLNPTTGNLAQKEWPKNITSDHCKTAYPGRPLIQYVLMLDAGSMGSRIHAYKFNYCNATPELEDEAAFGHVEPGLSSYGNDPEAAAQSLDKLLEISLKAVPLYLHSSTPIAVKATAGLRLLGDEMSNKILEAVRQRLESQYPFPIIKEQGVAVMDGAEEGVFAWVTVNYLLGRFSSLTKKATVAILDMGGASTQVVFEPQVVGGHSVAQGVHRYPMNFNGNQYVLYQHSHLGYGLMMARSQINNYLVANPINMDMENTLGQGEISHPCLPVGHRQSWTTSSGETAVLVGMSDPGGKCREVIEAIFYKHRPCEMWPCSFNGVYQPSLHTAFEDDIYAFSFFFDLTAPFRAGTAVQAQEMTIQELEDLTERVCKGDEDNFVEFHGSPEAMKELGKSTDMCMDLTYIYGLLEYGYGIPKDRKIKLAKKLKGYETGWFVGASIAVLEERDWYGEA